MGNRCLFVAALAAMILSSLVAMASDTGTESTESLSKASSMTVPEEYLIQFTSTDYNSSGGVLYESHLELRSNGWARFVDYWGAADAGSVHDISAVVSKDIVNYTRQAMDDDRLCNLNGTYNDAGTWHGGRRLHLDQFYITTPCGNRSLEFSYGAMIGIVPRTCVALDKVTWQLLHPGEDALQITVAVTASMLAGGIMSVSASVTNNGVAEFSMAGLCETIWPAKIVRTNGCSIEDLPISGALPYCVVTVGPNATFTFEAQKWNASRLAMGEYVVMATPGVLGMTILQVTEDLGHINDPPVVDVKVSEAEGAAGNTYEFDASGSCDAEDFVVFMEVRWDWYSDGVWDTDWSFVKTVTHTFENATGYNFTVEVRDTDGASSTAGWSVGQNTSTNLALLAPGVVVAVVAIVAVLAFMMLKRRKL